MAGTAQRAAERVVLSLRVHTSLARRLHVTRTRRRRQLNAAALLIARRRRRRQVEHILARCLRPPHAFAVTLSRTDLQNKSRPQHPPPTSPASGHPLLRCSSWRRRTTRSCLTARHTRTGSAGCRAFGDSQRASPRNGRTIRHSAWPRARFESAVEQLAGVCGARCSRH